jgi:hypothetical protein
MEAGSSEQRFEGFPGAGNFLTVDRPRSKVNVKSRDSAPILMPLPAGATRLDPELEVLRPSVRIVLGEGVCLRLPALHRFHQRLILPNPFLSYRSKGALVLSYALRNKRNKRKKGQTEGLFRIIRFFRGPHLSWSPLGLYDCPFRESPRRKLGQRPLDMVGLRMLAQQSADLGAVIPSPARRVSRIRSAIGSPVASPKM